MKENKEKKIKESDEISKLIKAFPKDLRIQKQESRIWNPGHILVTVHKLLFENYCPDMKCY